MVLTQGEFRRDFPGRKTPCRKTIKKIFGKFRNTESAGNDSKRYVTVRILANVQAVRKHLEQSSQKSTRRLSQEVGISITTVQRVIHNAVKLFPYKVQILQKQTKEERSEFCQTISERTGNNPGDLGLILSSDEAHFHLSGLVNKQNMRFWASQQSHKHTQRPLSQEKVTVWCTIGKEGDLPPVLF